MSTFVFKQFSVTQQYSAMKIGTDSVLLGCLCEVYQAKQILDIGTGTGLLALMSAQRNNLAQITAVEIEPQAAEEATKNAQQSPWKNRITVLQQSIQHFAVTNTQQFDVIISNPPYFEAGKNYNIQEASRNTARQTEELSFNELVDAVQKLLAPNGSFWLILPTAEALVFSEVAQAKLALQQQIFIHQKEGKEPNRVIMQWKHEAHETSTQHFIVFNADGTPSEAYKKIARDFYTGKQFQ